MASTGLKRVLLGRPQPSEALHHQLLPKWMALPVFSSDPLSSTAYATQEMMVILSLVGVAAYAYVLALSLGVAALLATAHVAGFEAGALQGLEQLPAAETRQAGQEAATSISTTSATTPVGTANCSLAAASR